MYAFTKIVTINGIYCYDLGIYKKNLVVFGVEGISK